MPGCKGINRRGKPCGYGSDCVFHPEANDGTDAGVPRVGGGGVGAAGGGEVRGGVLDGREGREVVRPSSPPPPPPPAAAPAADDPWASLADLPPAPAPEHEAAAAAPEAAELNVDGDALAAAADLAEAETTAARGSDDWLSGVPEAAAVVRGRWTPEKTGRVLNPALNALFVKSGKPKQTREEETYTGEVWAPIFDDLLSRVDPNSPYGALSLWALTVLGTRYAGEVLSLAASRKRLPPAAEAAGPDRSMPGPLDLW